jgi:hypothetical protein
MPRVGANTKPPSKPRRDTTRRDASVDLDGARVVGVTSAGQTLLDQTPQGGVGGRRPPSLAPLLLELYILTKDLQIVRLGDVINHAQQDFIERCERQLASRHQIRICVLKARQLGISTIIEGIIFVLSILNDNFNSKIVSHEDKSAKGILAMTKRYWSTYIFKDFHSETYNGQNHLAWNNGSDIDIATAKNLGGGRSQTIQALHASEVAFWPDPETLMTGLRQAIPSFGLNCIFIESTANGVGNFFHKTCNAAMREENEYEFVFYPWHEHPEYTAAFVSPDEIVKFSLAELNLAEAAQRAGHKVSPEHEEELRLRHRYGISDARLLWRRWAIQNLCQGDVNKFHQEYPTTPHEAFISTGRNVFPLGKLLDHYEPLIGKKGRLIRVNNGVKFVDDPNGYLTLFAEPSDDKDWGVYLAGGDPTHTTAGDFACVQVINRRTLEQVAVYRRKIDPINFGKDMQLIGHFYNTALLAPEKTGPGYATVGCIVGDTYPFVYITQNVAKMQGAPTDGLYGWLTNMQTKHLAISHLLKALLDPVTRIGNNTYGLTIHDEVTLLEMRDYVTTEDGQGYKNSDGSDYDDGVMALAIAIAVHNIEPPPSAYEVVQEHLLPARKGPVTKPLDSGTARPIDNQPADTRVELSRHPDFPEDFEDDISDEAPWEAWGRPREEHS